jgi:hypothetical protein
MSVGTSEPILTRQHREVGQDLPGIATFRAEQVVTSELESMVDGA